MLISDTVDVNEVTIETADQIKKLNEELERQVELFLFGWPLNVCIPILSVQLISASLCYQLQKLYLNNIKIN